MRQLTAELKASLKSRSLCFALLVQVDHPAGMARLWTGVGPLQWSDETWRGIGTIGGVSGVESSGQISIQSVDLTLSGVSREAIAEFLDGEIKGRVARIWWAAISDQGTVIPDPILCAVMSLDTRTYSIADDGGITLKISGQLGLWQLEKPLAWAWSSEQQKLTYPDDTGFDDIPGLINQKLAWTPS